MPPNATIFWVSICYHQLKYYSIKLTAKFYIDTISQTTKIPSFYVLNRIVIGRPTIQSVLVVGTNQTNECWATPSIYADTRRWVNIVLAMVHRLRRWINAQPTLIKRLVSAGICMMMV